MQTITLPFFWTSAISYLYAVFVAAQNFRLQPTFYAIFVSHSTIYALDLVSSVHILRYTNLFTYLLTTVPNGPHYGSCPSVRLLSVSPVRDPNSKTRRRRKKATSSTNAAHCWSKLCANCQFKTSKPGLSLGLRRCRRTAA